MEDTGLIVLLVVVIILKITLWSTVCACRYRRRVIYVRQPLPAPASRHNIIPQNHSGLPPAPYSLQVNSPNQNRMQGFVNPRLYMPQTIIAAPVPAVGAFEPPPPYAPKEGCAFPSPPEYSDC